jgi:GxxExxY protein
MTQIDADGPSRRVRECYETLFEEALTRRIIGAFYDVYNALGYGFLESVYANALAAELVSRGLHVVREARAEVRYRGKVVGMFRADLLVESRVVVELKASPKLHDADLAQLLNYLKATDLEVGLLLHFGPRAKVRRFVASNELKLALADLRESASSASSVSATGNAFAVAPSSPEQGRNSIGNPVDTRQHGL